LFAVETGAVLRQTACVVTSSPTVVCAWCNRLLNAGGQVVSHGICSACERNVMAKYEAARTRRAIG
jgi:hypothetical protein